MRKVEESPDDHQRVAHLEYSQRRVEVGIISEDFASAVCFYDIVLVMGAKETTIEELGEMLAHVVANMATRDDIAAVRRDMATKDDIAKLSEQLASIERELKSVRRDLEEIKEKVENVIGYRKEIDHALERIAAMEKDIVGIKRNAAV